MLSGVCNMPTEPCLRGGDRLVFLVLLCYLSSTTHPASHTRSWEMDHWSQTQTNTSCFAVVHCCPTKWPQTRMPYTAQPTDGCAALTLPSQSLAHPSPAPGAAAALGQTWLRRLPALSRHPLYLHVSEGAGIAPVKNCAASMWNRVCTSLPGGMQVGIHCRHPRPCMRGREAAWACQPAGCGFLHMRATPQV